MASLHAIYTVVYGIAWTCAGAIDEFKKGEQAGTWWLKLLTPAHGRQKQFEVSMVARSTKTKSHIFQCLKKKDQDSTLFLKLFLPIIINYPILSIYSLNAAFITKTIKCNWV